MNVKQHYVRNSSSTSGVGVLARGARNRILILMMAFSFSLVSIDAALAEEADDPFISVNRSVHGFNRAADSVIFKPLAQAYLKITPRIAQKGIRNFFSNLNDMQVVINDVLQLKFRQAGSDIGRLAINSTVGLGGVFNIASDVFGIDKHDEDFGQTLAHWGVAKGPYVVLPLFGPSTIRESAGLITGRVINPVQREGAGVQDKIYSVSAVDARASFLGFDDLVVGDDYLFLRGIYLQRLEYRSNDGVQQVSLTDF